MRVGGWSWKAKEEEELTGEAVTSWVAMEERRKTADKQETNDNIVSRYNLI